MSISITDLSAIMRAGGSVKVPASISTTDLSAIARAGKNKNAKLTVTNASTKSTTDLCAIARANPGNVAFEFE